MIFNRTTTIEGVTIVSRLPDSVEGFEVYMITLGNNPKQWRTNICPDYKTGFVEGTQFDEWTFEAREMCWSFAGAKHGFTLTKNYIAKGAQ